MNEGVTIQQDSHADDETVSFRVATGEEKSRWIIADHKNTVRLHISPFLTVEGMTMPNRWFRFWQWALLDWTWEKL